MKNLSRHTKEKDKYLKSIQVRKIINSQRKIAKEEETKELQNRQN